jgi:hypothetical protein
MAKDLRKMNRAQVILAVQLINQRIQDDSYESHFIDIQK